MRRKWVVVTVVCTVFAFLFGVNGPLGHLLGWHPAPGTPKPTPVELPLFVLLMFLEALAFGFGVAFLLFGYPWLRRAAPLQGRLTRLAHLSIAWVLLNWWSHDSFHIANGVDLGGLLVIEYAYHVTLMVAGALAGLWFMAVVRGWARAVPR